LKDYTLEEFALNISRVRNLVRVYEKIRAQGSGRKSVQSTDVLRAAVVFLHGALEEVIRNLFIWKLPDAGEHTLNEIPMIGVGQPSGRPEKFLLGKLANYKGRFVENLIRESIVQYVNYLNINNISDLRSCLEKIGLQPNQYTEYFADLAALMKRRHQIAHQADRNSEEGQGQHRAQSLSANRVKSWIESVEEFVKAVVVAVP
jgi:RiboL-PSP-HEPN